LGRRSFHQLGGAKVVKSVLQVSSIIERAGYRVGVAGPLVISCLFHRGTVELLAELERAHAAAVTACGRSSSLTVIAGVGALKGVEPDFQRESLALARRQAETSNGSAVVVLARGLGAVVARTFLTSYFLLAREHGPQRVFGSLEEAVPWLQALPGQSADFAQTPDAVLTLAIESFCLRPQVG
jgi:hypothetical protein